MERSDKEGREGEVSGGEQKTEEARIEGVKSIEHYHQLQQVVIEKNRAGEERKEEEGRGMGREADSFSIGKQHELRCEGEIPNTCCFAVAEPVLERT